MITDKRRPEMPRLAVLERLAQEIAIARQRNPQVSLVIGHGSGSFGHYVGRKYGTRQGVQTAEDWYGFAATGDAAARLNRMVTGALLAVGVPAWSLQPSVALRCIDGRVVDGPWESLERALQHGLVPVVYGDVALDKVRGGTIASTEEIFAWLATKLLPQRLILAGEVDGVYTADPNIDPSAQRIAKITPATFNQVQSALGDSHGVDVTGGMAAKVAEALALVTAHAGLDVLICSGLTPDNLTLALSGFSQQIGTRISAGV